VVVLIIASLLISCLDGYVFPVQGADTRPRIGVAIARSGNVSKTAQGSARR